MSLFWLTPSVALGNVGNARSWSGLIKDFQRFDPWSLKYLVANGEDPFSHQVTLWSLTSFVVRTFKADLCVDVSERAKREFPAKNLKSLENTASGSCRYMYICVDHVIISTKVFVKCTTHFVISYLIDHLMICRWMMLISKVLNNI